MALQRGIKVAGDYFDVGLYAKENGRSLMVFRIVSFEPPEPGDFGYKLPVVADVLVCDGPEMGAVYLGERHFGAPSGPLRGVKNPKRDEHPPFPAPVHKVGAELVYAVEYVDKKGAQAFVALNEPSIAEMKTVSAFYRDGAAWDVTPSEKGTPPDDEQREPAMAGAAAGGDKPPW